MTEEEELEQMMADALAERDAGDGAEEEEEDENEEEEEEDKPEKDDAGDPKTSEDDDGENTDDIEEHEESEKSGESSDSFSPIEVEVAGSQVTINSKEEMMAYIKKGAKAFETKPETHVEEKLVLDTAGITAEELKIYAEAKNGSKEALAKIAEMNKIDLFEIDEDTSKGYKQTLEYKQASEVDKVAQSILADEAQATAFRSTINTVPKEFVDKISSDANLLSHFNEHIKSGLASEVIPKVKHAMMVHGGDFFEHYARIGQEVFDAKNKQETKEERQVSEKAKALRKRASTSKGVSNSKVEPTTDDDIYNMSDAEFAEYQKNFSE